MATTPLPSERYLAEFVSALLDTAASSIERAGASARVRPELVAEAVNGPDIPKLARSITDALKSLERKFNHHLMVDREELDILWWVFGGHSTSLHKPFATLDICERSVAAGSDLAELVILPPVRASGQFLQAVIKEDCRVTLRQLIEGCGPEVLRSVTRRSSEAETILKAHPALLPLMWLSGRRIDSGMASGWESECEQRTHIASSEERIASSWALQVFNECTAVRLLSAVLHEEKEEEPE
jgi:hypothetical protein